MPSTKPQSIELNRESYFLIFSTEEENVKVKSFSEFEGEYYIFDGIDLRITKIPTNGKLLDGKYLKLDQQREVVESGYFLKGRKHGSWMLKKADALFIENYIHGIHDGDYYFYKSDVLFQKGRFTKDQKDGIFYYYQNGKIDHAYKYKKGLLVDTLSSNSLSVNIKQFLN